jgi:hypothetical protein
LTGSRASTAANRTAGATVSAARASAPIRRPISTGSVASPIAAARPAKSSGPFKSISISAVSARS